MGSTRSAYRDRLYEKERTAQVQEAMSLVDLYLSGASSLSKYKSAMQASLKGYYIRQALVAKGGRPLTQKDKSDIGLMLATSYDYLEGFTTALEDDYPEKMSSAQALARSGSYANAWGVYTRFALPGALADALPALPGIDCLGGMRCGCWLDWSATDTAVEVYWNINPVKENCVLCLDFTASWNPLVIDLSDLDPTLVDQEYDFLNDL
jgi:hypothetical protein